MNHPTHGMIQIPDGKTVADLLPHYAAVKNTLGPIGTPCKVCACCLLVMAYRFRCQFV